MKRTLPRYLFVFFLCCQTILGMTQNPFELEHRLEEGEIELSTPLNPGNPFEKANTAVTPPGTPSKESTVKANSRQSIQKVQSNPSGSFKFWIMTISLVFLTLLFVLYSSLVSKAYRGFLNENFLKMIHRNEGRIISVPYLLLYALYFVSAATFLYLLTDHFGWHLYKEPVRQYFACLAAIGVFFLVKHITLLLISSVFPIAKEVRQYSFTIVIFNIILGICLLPFNLFIAFTAPSLANGLIYLVLFLVLVFYIYRSFRALLIVASSMSFHKFHFFMYLCTVEIAPILLIASLLNGSGVPQ